MDLPDAVTSVLKRSGVPGAAVAVVHGGKTVFARGLAHGLGVGEPVVSPTFTLAREYRGRVRVVHADVYRLDHIRELADRMPVRLEVTKSAGSSRVERVDT